MEAIGSTGSLRLDDSFQGRATTLTGPDGFEVAIPMVNPYELELDDCAAAIRGEHPVRLGRADMLGQARALAALYDRDICLLAQAPTLPVFMGTMSFCVRGAVDAGGQAYREAKNSAS